MPTAETETDETPPDTGAEVASETDDESTPSSRWDRFDTAIVLVAAIATVFVHPVHQMLSRPYWLDEAWVAILAKVSWARLPGLSLTNPIGFAALIKLMPGSGLQRARLVVLGFSVLTVVAAYVLVRLLPWPTRSWARFSAVIGTVVVMLAPLSLGRNDLKQYTSDAFCALVILAMAARVDRVAQPAPAWWLAIVSVAALPFSSTSVFVSAAAFAGLLGSALIARARNRIVEVLVTGGATGVVLAGYFGAVVLPNTNAKLRAYWNTYYLTGTPWHMVHAAWNRLTDIVHPLGMPVVVFIALFLVGVVVLVLIGARAVAVAVPVLWIEMAIVARARRYPFLDLRTSHFLLVSSLVVVAVGVAGLLQLVLGWQKIVGTIASIAVAALFLGSVRVHVDKLGIPFETAREQTQYVAAHSTPSDVVLVNSSGTYGFAYYWPDGKVVAITDHSVGQGFRAQVAGLNAVYATGRTDAAVLDALRAAVARWHAAPPGSRLYIVRSHVSAGEKTAWHRAFAQLGLHPRVISTGVEPLVVLDPPTSAPSG